MKNKNRKPSWQYLDLALKIQVAPRHDSAKLVLIFLAAKSNNLGESYHGYSSIRAHFGFGNSTISRALRYLRDDLHILTWQHGSGGFQKKDTNQYQLDLDAMKALVTAQDIFDVETGRLKKYLVESHGDTKSSPTVGLSVESHGREVESHEHSVESHEDASRVPPQDTNPHGTLRIKNPQIRNQEAGASFSASSPSSSGMEVARSSAPAPLLRHPPVESHESSRTTYGDPGAAVSDKFLNDHAPAKKQRLPKTAKELAQEIHGALQSEVPDAPILKAISPNWADVWCTSLGYAIAQKWASIDELCSIARFAIDHKLPKILDHGVPGLVGALHEVRSQMKEAEVTA